MNGRSIALRREWDDRHFMNREPSLIDLSASGVPSVRARSAAGPVAQPARLAAVPAPAEVTFRPNMAARAGSAQLTYRDFANGGCA